MTALLFSSGWDTPTTVPIRKLIPELGAEPATPVASTFFIVAALASMGVPGLAILGRTRCLRGGSSVLTRPRNRCRCGAGGHRAFRHLATRLQSHLLRPQNQRYDGLPDISRGWDLIGDLRRSCFFCGSTPSSSFRRHPYRIGPFYERTACLDSSISYEWIALNRLRAGGQGLKVRGRESALRYFSDHGSGFTGFPFLPEGEGRVRIPR